MTCTVSMDAYAIAEGMLAEEQDLMRRMVDLAKERASLQANSLGYGPERTKMHVEREMLKARDVAHDRVLLRQIKEGLVSPEHAKAHNIDLNALIAAERKQNG